MKPVCFPACAVLALASLTAIAGGQQAPALRVLSPAPDSIISGATRVEATVEPAEARAMVQTISFFANGRLVCTAERPPYRSAGPEQPIVDQEREHELGAG